jgi:tetrathionate reductase subunit B
MTGEAGQPAAPEPARPVSRDPVPPPVRADPPPAVSVPPEAPPPVRADPPPAVSVPPDPTLPVADPVPPDPVPRRPTAPSPPPPRSPTAPSPAPATPATPSPAPCACAASPDASAGGATPTGGAPCGDEGCVCAPRGVDRRRFLGYALTIAAGVAGAAVLGQLAPLFAADDAVADPEPITPVYDPERVAWTFIVDTGRCIGCGLCVGACKEENHLPEEAMYNRTWVERHVTTFDGVLHIDSPEGGIHGFPPSSEAPGVGGRPITQAFFSPRLCMQCEDPPCVGVCPVSATYVTTEGIVLVDDARCIGCAYCVVACPYGARYLIPATERTPLGIPGVADKCTWCYHRIARGLVPACVEVCPVGARKFGDRNDPASEVAAVLRDEAPAPLWPEYGTRPQLFYVGPITEQT